MNLLLEFMDILTQYKNCYRIYSWSKQNKIVFLNILYEKKRCKHKFLI